MENKQGATKGIIVVIITLVIMLVMFLISNAIENNLTSKENTTMNAQLNKQVLIKEIKTSKVRNISKSLINVDLSVSYDILPESATNKSIDIVSSDSSIVRVNENNTITALSVGKVTLTLVSNDGSNVTSTIEVVVD